ncbi:MAG: sulfate ABC transporter substrate-binding protein [Candidatus Accumulibacter phosphatis]|jgi:sulfate/thiosulfate-binding protein|uniref:Sulfate ABC transporter substrate-binding protein n=1 Tax=Candidatus Accumulibacter contiguus TaxID=2954381 RepID=A0ABX1TA69_9PROT|nr:sulfate ABC transporter substrate-binding protein [Candidatus Accumulibacter contiguus]NMQ06547.1 sulfate ABC transporter substrate-binding protein [Candidatus Accumulibacter contiguus]
MATRKLPWINLAAVAAAALAITLIVVKNVEGKAPAKLLNVSYDPTRELYRDINAGFTAGYEKASGRAIEVLQSHGGSSRQARLAVGGELKPDVVTLGLPSDVDVLRKHGQIADGWAARLPNQSRPYYSTIVFVVRQGNPQGIHDWPDLVKPGVEVITPDPKSSGNGKLTALAAWGAIVTRGGSEVAARAYLKTLYEHTPFLVPAARAAGTAFAVEKIGDVHLAWENEALREVAEARGQLEIVYPPVSILAEPSVAWVDANVASHGSAEAARAYLEYLFTDEGQEIIARNGYRPFKPQILANHADKLPPLKLFAVTAIARDWDDAQSKFFADNGIIDTVYRPKPR